MNGRKLQLLTDTLSRIWKAVVHPVNQHDSPEGIPLLEMEDDQVEALKKIIGDNVCRGSFPEACANKSIEFEV